MRAGLYARVSTSDQRLDAQVDDLRRHAQARDWSASEFTDHGVSGARDRRPGLDALMAAARRREIDVVVVPAFDRFARSTRHLLTALDEFAALRVEFVSLREQIDTSTPLGRMVFTVVAAVAELERELIRERVRAGMAAAQRRGKHVGRPRRYVDVDRARRLIAEGRSLRATARVLGVAPVVLRRALARQDARQAAISMSDGFQADPVGGAGTKGRSTHSAPSAPDRGEPVTAAVASQKE